MLRSLRPFLFLLAAAVPLAALAAEAPDALVRRVTDEVLAIVRADADLQKGDQSKVVQLAEAKVLPHFDFARMTRLAMGRNWSKASDAEKEALVKAFRTMLVRTYSSSLGQYRNQKIEVKPLRATPQDEDVTVRTAVIQQGGPPIPIDYAMEKAPEGWKVYDVVIDGASLVTTYRGTFNEQVRKSGVSGLVQALEERNRALGASGK